MRGRGGQRQREPEEKARGRRPETKIQREAGREQEAGSTTARSALMEAGHGGITPQDSIPAPKTCSPAKRQTRAGQGEPGRPSGARTGPRPGLGQSISALGALARSRLEGRQAVRAGGWR